MPLYEYRCDDCGVGFETLVRSAGLADRQPCAECGSPQARRMLSVFSTPRASGGEGASMPMAGPSGGGAAAAAPAGAADAGAR